MFDVTIDGTTKPTTTNYPALSQTLTSLLNAQLQISTNITTDPNLDICKFWVGLMIREFGAYTELKEDYISPEAFVTTPHFLSKMAILDPLIQVIKGNMDTEDEPAYTRQMGMGYGGGGAELD